MPGFCYVAVIDRQTRRKYKTIKTLQGRREARGESPFENHARKSSIILRTLEYVHTIPAELELQAVRSKQLEHML